MFFFFFEDDFPKRLTATMENRGIDARLLSLIAGVSLTTVERWINGKFLPRQPNLSKIADALDVSSDYLIGRA